MDDSREESPDWLREFQAPSRSLVLVSSASESSPENSPKQSSHTPESSEVKKEQDTILIESEEESPVIKSKKPKALPMETDQNLSQDTATLGVDEEIPDEDVKETATGHSISSRLPLVFPEKVQRSKALVECNGDSIDLSGDVGAVGRMVIANAASGNHEMLLDLKGTMYKTTIVPSRTFCIVSIGQSEAKIEAIMNDFIHLEPQSNVFEAETMIEGTLDGFSFDSDEETAKVTKPPAHQNDQNNENGDQTFSKPKRKMEKDAANKNPKATGRPGRTRVRKPQVAKKAKKSNK